MILTGYGLVLVTGDCECVKKVSPFMNVFDQNSGGGRYKVWNTWYGVLF